MSRFQLCALTTVIVCLSCKTTSKVIPLQDEISILKDEIEMEDLVNERHIKMDELNDVLFRLEMHDSLVRHPSKAYQELLPIYKEVSGYRKHKDIVPILDRLVELKVQKEVFEYYIQMIDEERKENLSELKSTEDSLGKRELAMSMQPYRKGLLKFDEESGRNVLVKELIETQDELEEMDEKSGRTRKKKLLSLKIHRLSQLLNEEQRSN